MKRIRIRNRKKSETFIVLKNIFKYKYAKNEESFPKFYKETKKCLKNEIEKRTERIINMNEIYLEKYSSKFDLSEFLKNEKKKFFKQ